MRSSVRVKKITGIAAILAFLDYRPIAATRGVTTATMYRANGALALLSGRVHGRVFVSVIAYELGRPNSDDDLRQHISTALSDFVLTAATGWRTVCPV